MNYFILSHYFEFIEILQQETFRNYIYNIVEERPYNQKLVINYYTNYIRHILNFTEPELPQAIINLILNKISEETTVRILEETYSSVITKIINHKQQIRIENIQRRRQNLPLKSSWPEVPFPKSFWETGPE